MKFRKNAADVSNAQNKIQVFPILLINFIGTLGHQSHGGSTMQKIVQLPFQIPRQKEADITEYINEIISKTLESNLVDEFKNNDLILKAVQLNPREVKRFVNNVILVLLVPTNQNGAYIVADNEIVYGNSGQHFCSN